ncbi:hypothetical protein BS638_06000 [Clostridium tepidum]|uniref:DUF1878 domain-containing protein n=1 Tax=Clostridium tepidum TaxID=1962263 RepID=A0A1S9IA36_9CLOT|nr:hypothetical protein [Clostridium tepidum]OOO67082.1 hypothetical protein BS638_06000 [Clostridium tepidum]
MSNEEKIKYLEDKINLLEWKIQILQDNVCCKSFFNIMLEMDITKEQHSKIVNLILKYADHWEEGKYSRYSFEDEMANINNKFKLNTQAIEIILKDLAEEENDYNYKQLFIKLYGDMPKYKNIFPEIKR